MKTIRDGKKVWPYCPECGCRLALTSGSIHAMDKVIVGHFGDDSEVDARGHECSRLFDVFVVNYDKVKHWMPRNVA